MCRLTGRRHRSGNRNQQVFIFLTLVLSATSISEIDKIKLYGSIVSICLPESSCDARCGYVMNATTTCSCDNDCSTFGDCCYDFKSECKSSQDDKTTQEESKVIKNTKCFQTDPDLPTMGYHVISTCLNKSTEKTITTKCENPDIRHILEQILVTDSLGNVYRNIYCAECDGVQTADLAAWRVTASCNEDDVQREAAKENSEFSSFSSSFSQVDGPEQKLHDKLGIHVSCRSYNFTPPTDRKLPRSCMLGQGTCPDRYRDEQTKIGCSVYSATVYVDDTGFKNPHCAICNGYGEYTCERAHTDKTTLRPSGQRPGRPGMPGSPGPPSPPGAPGKPGPPTQTPPYTTLDILVNFADGKISLKSEYISYSESPLDCGVGKVYNYVMEECIDLQCPSGFMLSGSKCIAVTRDRTRKPSSECNRNSPKIPNEMFCLCQSDIGQAVVVTYLTKNDNMSSDDLADHMIGRIIDTNIVLINKTKKYVTEATSVRYNVSFETSDCKDVAYLSSVTQDWIYADDNEKSLEFATFAHHCLGSGDNTSNNDSCVTETVSANQIDIRESNETRIITNDKESITVPINGYTLYLTYDIQNDSTTCVSLTVDACIDSPPDGTCPLVELKQKSFIKHVDNNVTILHKATGKVFTSDEYSVTANGSILVCSFFSQTGSEQNGTILFVYSDSLLVVNITGVVLSLVGLFLTFTIRCVFKELRTHSGKIIMNLSLALFVAQLLTLLQGYFLFDVDVCTAMAAVLHYMWLVAFLWMNSMAIDLFRIFRSIKLSGRDEEHTKIIYRRYMLYSWCTPAVFVGILLSVHFSDVSFLSFKYGDESVCWIRKESATLLFFGLPISLVIIINVILFICTIIGIRKAKRSATRIQTKSKRNKISEELTIYIRISTIMGLTWVFGFLASFVDHIAIWYIFIILNTLQGLFIFIAFNFNRTMRATFRNRTRLHQSSTTRTNNEVHEHVSLTDTSRVQKK